MYLKTTPNPIEMRESMQTEIYAYSVWRVGSSCFLCCCTGSASGIPQRAKQSHRSCEKGTPKQAAGAAIRFPHGFGMKGVWLARDLNVQYYCTSTHTANSGSKTSLTLHYLQSSEGLCFASNIFSYQIWAGVPFDATLLNTLPRTCGW